MEAELLFNRKLNEQVAKKYGAAYQNPFNSLFFVPLDPVYNNRNNLVTAKKELDECIIDILSMFMRFDLADLLSRVGTNNDFGANWAHTLAYLRIRYPVQDYIDYMHEYLKLLETLGTFMEAKKEALGTINDGDEEQVRRPQEPLPEEPHPDQQLPPRLLRLGGRGGHPEGGQVRGRVQEAGPRAGGLRAELQPEVDQGAPGHGLRAGDRPSTA